VDSSWDMPRSRLFFRHRKHASSSTTAAPQQHHHQPVGGLQHASLDESWADGMAGVCMRSGRRCVPALKSRPRFALSSEEGRRRDFPGYKCGPITSPLQQKACALERVPSSGVAELCRSVQTRRTQTQTGAGSTADPMATRQGSGRSGPKQPGLSFECLNAD